MFAFLKKMALLALVLVAALVVGVWLRSQGVIPEFTELSDPDYRRLSGVEPSSGSIWRWRSESPTGGFAYYRLNLSNSSYRNRGGAILTEANKPDLPGAPWWWSAGANGRSSVAASGNAMNRTRHYEIYDPDAEMLFVYGEWPGK